MVGPEGLEPSTNGLWVHWVKFALRGAHGKRIKQLKNDCYIDLKAPAVGRSAADRQPAPWQTVLVGCWQ